MKTLESILNSPNRMLSNDEMLNLKGGYPTCLCILMDSEDYTFAMGLSGVGSCSEAGNLLMQWYGDTWEHIQCVNY